MSKAVQWIIWVLAVVAINIPATLIAAFSLFGTAEGTSIFSLDYLLAFGILLLSNIVILQLAIVIGKGRRKEFIFGLLAAVVQAIGIYIIVDWSYTAGLIITGIGIFAAILLLINALKK